MTEADGPGSRLVSVVVPVFNAADTLGETLVSVARQNYTAIEILIVDDGSTDSSPDIAAAFCKQDARARLIEKSNGGVASARNLGIAEARGSFVAPIDADDLWHPTHLAKLVAKAVQSYPTPGFVFALSRQIDRNSDVIWSGASPSVYCPGVRQMAYQNLVGCGSGLLMSRSAAVAVGGYDERLRAAGLEGYEDYLLQLTIAASHPIGLVPEYLVGYRQRSNSMSSDMERMYESGNLAYSLFRKRFPDLHIPISAQRWNCARRLVALGRYRARHGRLIGAAQCVAIALGHDPIGTGAAILYDVQRLTAQALLRIAGSATPTAPFYDVDPRMVSGTGKKALRSWLTPHGMLQRLQRARMRHFETIDRASPVTNRYSQAGNGTLVQEMSQQPMYVPDHPAVARKISDAGVF